MFDCHVKKDRSACKNVEFWYPEEYNYEDEQYCFICNGCDGAVMTECETPTICNGNMLWCMWNDAYWYVSYLWN
jgi:hypothetical protein